MMTAMEAYKTHYETLGYVVVPRSLVIPSETTFQDVLAAVTRIVAKARSGEWPHRRAVGRQFPPHKIGGKDDAWGVQHLIHPDLGEDAKVLKRWYTSPEVCNVVCGLVGCTEEELQLELVNLLINPESHDFALRWHRDDIRGDASIEEEEKGLAIWAHGVQWNTALYDDSCLYIVPGTHNTVRTPEQRALSTTLEAPKNPLDMPGAIVVPLKPGETVFYNSNILHLGIYTSKTPRATLHACMGSTQGGSSRARNVLQHGLDWMSEESFKDGLDKRGLKMLENTLRMKEGAGEIGFSLVN
ncbi:hypothetical protein EIP91_003708 [Steccherinum ochraceum]|uniref:Phytanoyl-CoA dioxygenase family protein n=1 Tax=Steccherinum ochraceum TaxID=92696 RepID=A0A4R0RRD5_9APHY|nr:hypothetical protein EIP91_003708 [Steccherinum ochraceum]